MVGVDVPKLMVPGWTTVGVRCIIIFLQYRAGNSNTGIPITTGTSTVSSRIENIRSSKEKRGVFPKAEPL